MSALSFYALVGEDGHESGPWYDTMEKAIDAGDGTQAVIAHEYVFSDSELVWTPDGGHTWPSPGQGQRTIPSPETIAAHDEAEAARLNLIDAEAPEPGPHVVSGAAIQAQLEEWADVQAAAVDQVEKAIHAHLAEQLRRAGQPCDKAAAAAAAVDLNEADLPDALRLASQAARNAEHALEAMDSIARHLAACYEDGEPVTLGAVQDAAGALLPQ